MLHRRDFLAASAIGTLGLSMPLRTVAADVMPKIEDGIAWFNVQDWGVEGKGWSETARYYDRLPAKAEKSVRQPVWELSRHSAGMLARFTSDATAIRIRYTLLSPQLDMPHMPATGVSGLDLYARDARGRDRWLAVVAPSAQTVDAVAAGEIDPPPDGKPRLFTVYLPLYNGVESLEIGVDAKSAFEPVAPRGDKPIVFYGTSIMHGACASRPGMSISGIVGRRLNRPTINLGFSGNGRMEPEIGDLLSELDPCVYCIDCLPNMQGSDVAQHAVPLVKQLHRARPETPIVLVEDRAFTNSPFVKSRRDRHEANRAALRKAFEQLTAEGVKGLSYLPGDELLGDDGEAATDGSHPSDLGMLRYADAYERALSAVLTGSGP